MLSSDKTKFFDGRHYLFRKFVEPFNVTFHTSGIARASLELVELTLVTAFKSKKATAFASEAVPVRLRNTVVPVLFASASASRNLFVTGSLKAYEATTTLLVRIAITLAFVETIPASSANADVSKLGAFGSRLKTLRDAVVPHFFASATASRNVFIARSLKANEASRAVSV